MKKINTVLGISTLTLLVACGSESGDGSGTEASASVGGGAGTAMELEPVTTFATQSDAGLQAYATYCSACHGAGLEGTALGPMLSGGGFLGSYGRQSPFEFFNFTCFSIQMVFVPKFFFKTLKIIGAVIPSV